MHNEKILIESLRKGDKKAFGKLFDNNFLPLYRFMSQFSGDRDQVNEWVQRAFIKSYENIEKFDGLSRYSTWLFKIALNEMKMDMRRKSNKDFRFLDENDHPVNIIEDTDLQWQQVMKEWLFELDEVKRAVFILFEVEGYSHPEIAVMLGIKESASRTILTRTKYWLRCKWEEAEKTAEAGVRNDK